MLVWFVVREDRLTIQAVPNRGNIRHNSNMEKRSIWSAILSTTELCLAVEALLEVCAFPSYLSCVGHAEKSANLILLSSNWSSVSRYTLNPASTFGT